ncbi:MAG: cob(I)yrinic acid a,c-diamide adenosyltransferase [Candidatus Microgenomates bacterium]
MHIYTKTGDKGETSLFGGKRVLKSDVQIEAYGQIDELTSFIGLVSTITKKDEQFLIQIQKDLYRIMAYLSGAKINLDFLEKRVLDFEKRIDEIEKNLPKLNNFIIPGADEHSAWFHILRTICRRVERVVVKLNQQKPVLNIITYFNRLSDLFFVLARKYGKNKELLLK